MYRFLLLSLGLATLGIGCESTGSHDVSATHVSQTEPLTPITVAVVIQSHPRYPESGETVLTAIENHLLRNYPHVTIVDRVRVKEILAEKHLQESDLFSQETAVEVGKLLRADAVIAGSVQAWQGVTEVTDSEAKQLSRHFIGFGIGGRKIDNTCSVEFNLRARDVDGGRVWLAENAADDGDSFGEACQKALNDKKVRGSFDAALRRRAGGAGPSVRS